MLLGKKAARNVESKIRNKGKFNCDALATEASATRTGSSEAGWCFGAVLVEARGLAAQRPSTPRYEPPSGGEHNLGCGRSIVTGQFLRRTEMLCAVSAGNAPRRWGDGCSVLKGDLGCTP